MDGIASLASLAFGFGLTKLLSTPKYKIIDRIPELRFRALQILPNIKIYVNNRILHIHHWIFLSLVFATLMLSTNFNQLLLVKGFCLGGIIQGFTFADRFKILVQQSRA